MEPGIHSQLASLRGSLSFRGELSEGIGSRGDPLLLQVGSSEFARNSLQFFTDDQSNSSALHAAEADHGMVSQ